MTETFRCEYVNCGKCNAACAHGPYWYAYRKVAGKTTKRYVGKTDPRKSPDRPADNHHAHVEGFHAVFEPILSAKTASLDLAWEILNVPRDCSAMTAKQAYRQKCLIHHPDGGGSVRMMQYVQAAYSYLKARHGWK